MVFLEFFHAGCDAAASGPGSNKRWCSGAVALSSGGNEEFQKVIWPEPYVVPGSMSLFTCC